MLRTASPAALGSLQDYLESLSDGFEALRLAGSNQPDFDEGVIKSIGAFTPYRDEYLSVLGSLVRTPLSEDLVLALKRFFERLIPFLTRPPQLMSWSDHWFDNYGFIIHELFLYTVAVLIKHERFAEVSAFLGDGFYAAALSETGRADPIQPFTVFRHHLPSLAMRNQRLKLGRLSLHADLLKDRVPARGVAFDDLMQADLVLFLRAAAQGEFWWPESLIWSGRKFIPFEIFARGRSQRYLKGLLPMLGASNKDECSMWSIHSSISGERTCCLSGNSTPFR